MSSTITYHRIGIFLAFILFFLFATPTHAYFTTAQSAEKLDGQSAFFSIEYAFGMKKREVYMPVFAHNQSAPVSESAVSYAILDEDGKEIAGKMTAIVFSKATLTKEAMYVTKKGTSNTFTLAVVFTPETYDAEKTYRLQVTHLPFNFDGTQQLQLNPSELQYYTTKPISL